MSKLKRKKTKSEKPEKASQLSLKQQIYLESVYELCRKHGHAHVKEIAESLSNRMASVTEAMRTLSSMGLVNYSARKAVTLTGKGERIALQLQARHSILEEFYVKILGCSKRRAEEIACRVEHVVDAEHVERLERLMKYLEKISPKRDFFK